MGVTICFCITDFIHQEYTTAINQHIPGANHGAIRFPLNGHIVYNVISEIGE